MANVAYQVTDFAYQGAGQFAYQGSADGPLPVTGATPGRRRTFPLRPDPTPARPYGWRWRSDDYDRWKRGKTWEQEQADTADAVRRERVALGIEPPTVDLQQVAEHAIDTAVSIAYGYEADASERILQHLEARERYFEAHLAGEKAQRMTERERQALREQIDGLWRKELELAAAFMKRRRQAAVLLLLH